MSMFPKKYHGPDVKCSGPQYCNDCKERILEGLLIWDEQADIWIHWTDSTMERINQYDKDKLKKLLSIKLLKN